MRDREKCQHHQESGKGKLKLQCNTILYKLDLQTFLSWLISNNHMGKQLGIT